MTPIPAALDLMERMRAAVQLLHPTEPFDAEYFKVRAALEAMRSPIAPERLADIRALVPDCFADEDEVPLVYVRAGELRALLNADARIDAAVLAEREACANICDTFTSCAFADPPFGLVAVAMGHAIRSRPAPEPAVAPGHTDLMVTPEAIDRFIEDNPPPADDSALQNHVLREQGKVPPPSDFIKREKADLQAMLADLKTRSQPPPTPDTATQRVVEAARAYKRAWDTADTTGTEQRMLFRALDALDGGDHG